MQSFVRMYDLMRLWYTPVIPHLEDGSRRIGSQRLFSVYKEFEISLS